MKIGIDARFYGEAGPGRYVSQLLKNLEAIDDQNQYIVYLKKSNYGSYLPRNNNFQKKLANYRWYSFSEQTLFLLDLYKEDFDLVHFTQVNTPILYLKPFVVTIHDTILHEFSMERGNLFNRLIYKIKRWPYFLVFAKDVFFSKSILVPSQATKDDLLRYYKSLKSEKIEVTHEAVDHYPNPQNAQNEEDVLNKYHIKKPYLLSLGSFYPHKNTKKLIEAFSLLKKKELFRGQLVLVGRKSYFSKMWKTYVDENGIEDVIFPGEINYQSYIVDDEAEVILKNATVYIQPALKEGFGIPPVEAMVFGVPTAVSDITCLREMCGDASIFFNPKDVTEMATKIGLLLGDETRRQDIVKKGFANIKRFSWSELARETLKVYVRSQKL